MTYNTKISEVVSLSKILDALFLHEFAEPDVIIEFLKMHEASISDILSESFCRERLFQLDFVYFLSDKKQRWWLDYLINDDIYAHYSLKKYLAWQIAYAYRHSAEFKDVYLNSAKYRIKYLLSKELLYIKHPHSSRLSNEKIDLDYVYELAAAKKYYASTSAEILQKHINEPTSEIMLTLFCNRYMQYDTFSLCDWKNKHIFLIHILQEILHYCPSDKMSLIYPCIGNFLKQLLEYESDENIKKYVIDAIVQSSIYKGLISYIVESKDFIKLLATSLSVEEFILNSDLQGYELTSNNMLYLMQYKKSWFKKLQQIRKEELDLILKIPKI